MYLVKSNLLVFFMVALPISFLYGIIGEASDSLNATLVSLLAVTEGFIVKIGYDYINYDYDFKYHKHRLSKIWFMVLPIVLNLLALFTVIMISGSYRWLLIIGLVASNFIHILVAKSLYTLPLVGVVIFSNLIYIYNEANIYYWLAIAVMIYLPVAYWLIHRKVKIHTNDNYD